MQTCQENSSDRQSTKATDLADTTTVLDSFEPQDDFQICVKIFQITCMEKMKTMENALMSGLSSLHRKMDFLLEKCPCKCDMIFHQQYQTFTLRDRWDFQIDADIQFDADEFLSKTRLINPYLPTYEDSLKEKNENENEHGNSKVHRTQTSDTPKTPQQGTLKNAMDVVSKIADAFNDLAKNRPPPYDEIFGEVNLETVTKKSKKAFECQKTGPTDSEENRPPAYHENFCKVNLETVTKKSEKAFERQKTGLTDSDEKDEHIPQAYDGNTCEEILEPLAKNDKEAFKCQQADLTDSDEKGENRPPAYDGILCEESLEALTKEVRDASCSETDNTSVCEGPVYTNIFTDEMDTKEDDEHPKYNTNIHSTEENHELPKQNKENLYRNETAKMNNGFRKHKDKTMSEEDVSEFSKAMLSVGILYLPHCTSTLFRAGTIYGITAAHTFAKGKNIKDEDIGTLLRHKATKVDFGRFNQHRKFRLVEAVFIDEDLDIAILRFNDEDKHKLPPPLYICSNDNISELVDEVALIGVGHRNNNLKVLEHDVKVIQKSRISEDQIRVYLHENYEHLKNICISNDVDMKALDESYGGMMSPHNIILNAFSGHGASGAPVLSKTNPVTVIGVFTSGYPKIIYNIPELLPVFPPQFTFECATNSSYIFGKVVQSRENLANDIFTEKME